MIRITAKPERGFYRCGVYHPPNPVDWPADAWTPEQLERLKTEARLVVEHVADPEPAGERTTPPTDTAPQAPEQQQAAAQHAAEAATGDADSRPAKIADAMRRVLVERREGDFMADGQTPTVEAVERAFGGQVTAGERNAAWEALQAEEHGK